MKCKISMGLSLLILFGTDGDRLIFVVVVVVFQVTDLGMETTCWTEESRQTGIISIFKRVHWVLRMCLRFRGTKSEPDAHLVPSNPSESLAVWVGSWYFVMPRAFLHQPVHQQNLQAMEHPSAQGRYHPETPSNFPSTPWFSDAVLAFFICKPRNHKMFITLKRGFK